MPAQGHINIVGAVLGGLAGLGIWIGMIVITTGVCAVPVLNTLWCTPLPYASGAVSSSISLWDMFLLVVFIIVGVRTGAKA
jgi:small-conductance mechanosensitive channel